MKANRKFVEGKEAVSAVIGVILMVAITVAIAATVYVYVTGFGSSTTPTPSMSIKQQSAVATHNVTFEVQSASTDAKWADLSVVVNGTAYTAGVPSSGSVSATDTFWVDNDADVVAGNSLQIVHTPSNSVILEKVLY